MQKPEVFNFFLEDYTACDGWSDHFNFDFIILLLSLWLEKTELIKLTD